MIVEIFSLCDAATAENGKLNILGAFDTIRVRNFPVVYPYFAVAVRARFPSIEKGDHRVAVRLIDVDGKDVLPPAQGAIRVDFTPQQRSVSANLILNVRSLDLKEPGEFSLELSVDGVNMRSLPLFVRPLSSGEK